MSEDVHNPSETPERAAARAALDKMDHNTTEFVEAVYAFNANHVHAATPELPHMISFPVSRVTFNALSIIGQLQGENCVHRLAETAVLDMVEQLLPAARAELKRLREEEIQEN